MNGVKNVKLLSSCCHKREKPMALFIKKSFTAHAGSNLPFKIEVDSLTDEDISTLAFIIGSKLQFSAVYGIPRGGTRLAATLKKYCNETGPTLIVDDVLTTGTSMEEARNEIGKNSIGVVIFSRGMCPSWISTVFQLSEWAQP